MRISTYSPNGPNITGEIINSIKNIVDFQTIIPNHANSWSGLKEVKLNGKAGTIKISFSGGHSQGIEADNYRILFFKS